MDESRAQPLEYGAQRNLPPRTLGRRLCGIFGLLLTLIGGLGVISFVVFTAVRLRYGFPVSDRDKFFQHLSAGASVVWLVVGVFLLRRRFARS